MSPLSNLSGCCCLLEFTFDMFWQFSKGCCCLLEFTFDMFWQFSKAMLIHYSDEAPSIHHNLGGRHIQAYAIKASFQRSYLNKGQGADHKKVANSSRPNSGDSGSSNSYVNAVKNHKSVDHDSMPSVLTKMCSTLKLWTLKHISKEFVTRWGNLIDTNDSDGNCFHSKRLCLFTKSISNIYENFKIIFRGKVYWIRAKEVPGWTPDLVEDSDEEELSVTISVEERNENLESRE
ncbi:hypothetical protein Tco_0726190 [Tanacetum coccineum]|uniref:Uncharacterized protein n=1 Tax=Tanacetum coccineum TaxID=301880 RepID=A0ABQ4YF06_9ASTR